MKILIVFYSLTGNTKKLAMAIAAAAGGDLLEIKTKKEIPGNGFAKYWAAGLQIIKRGLPELLPADKNPGNYDLIFLGTPVWAATLAPAVHSFLLGSKLKNKKIALFCAHGGDNPGKAFEELRKGLTGNEIVGQLDFKMDMIPSQQLSANLKRAADWARKIAGK